MTYLAYVSDGMSFLEAELKEVNDKLSKIDVMNGRLNALHIKDLMIRLDNNLIDNLTNFLTLVGW